MKYLQPRFSVSMPGGACDWPFVPRDAQWLFWREVERWVIQSNFKLCPSR